MMTHTPGPWTVDDNYIMCRYDGNGNYICRMLGRGEETDANATLIAAAPDLLAACKVALNAINLNDETLTAREHLQAAIAKATQS